MDDDETVSQQPSMPVLQDDLIIEILVRVPARSLLQFKCVCKTWNVLISDPLFAKHHLRISTANPSMTHQQRLLTTGISKRFKILSWPLKSQFEKSSTHNIKPFNYSLSDDDRCHRILGSCNGLICLYAHAINRVYVQLWNPLTRLRSKRSPTVEGIVAYHGLGYDSVNDKYKVLVGLIRPFEDGFCELLTKVYTFGEKGNCWRTIQKFPYNNNLSSTSRTWPWSSGKFVSNTLNWVEKSDDDVGSNNNWVIISFDLEKETYSEILLPKNQGDDGQPENTCDPVLDVFKNRICVCFSSYETGGVVWLMKEYGVFESWTKLMVVKPHQKLTYFAPFCISQNGILFARNFSFSESLLYEPNTNMFCLPRIMINRLSLDYNIYHESLVSPRRLG